MIPMRDVDGAITPDYCPLARKVCGWVNDGLTRFLCPWCYLVSIKTNEILCSRHIEGVMAVHSTEKE